MFSAITHNVGPTLVFVCPYTYRYSWFGCWAEQRKSTRDPPLILLNMERRITFAAQLCHSTEIGGPSWLATSPQSTNLIKPGMIVPHGSLRFAYHMEGLETQILTTIWGSVIEIYGYLLLTTFITRQEQYGEVCSIRTLGIHYLQICKNISF